MKKVKVLIMYSKGIFIDIKRSEVPIEKVCDFIKNKVNKESGIMKEGKYHILCYLGFGDKAHSNKYDFVGAALKKDERVVAYIGKMLPSIIGTRVEILTTEAEDR